MKKVLFLMFLLLLMGLGAANVNAQVRIGGNTPPNAATVLDLNTNDNVTPAGNHGLALPRVHLASDTIKLIAGVANLTGMIVYNTTTTLGAGIYYWNGTTWVRAGLPSVTSADSGKILMAYGNVAIWTSQYLADYANPDSITGIWSRGPASWSKIVDTLIRVSIPPQIRLLIKAPGVLSTDLCYEGGTTVGPFVMSSTTNAIRVWSLSQVRQTTNLSIRCYRPSL